MKAGANVRGLLMLGLVIQSGNMDNNRLHVFSNPSVGGAIRKYTERTNKRNWKLSMEFLGETIDQTTFFYFQK